MLINSRSGQQRRFSLDRRFLLFLLFSLLLLAGSGTLGAWKAGENLELTREKQRLETEQQHMQAIARTVTKIEREKRAIHDLLGLRDTERTGHSQTADN